MNNLKAINERYIQDIDDEDDEIVTSDITKHYDKIFRISVSVKKCTADDFIPSMEYIKDMLDDIFDVYFELDGYETVLLAQDNANNYELVEINERNCKKFFDIKGFGHIVSCTRSVFFCVRRYSTSSCCNCRKADLYLLSLIILFLPCFKLNKFTFGNTKRHVV